MEANPDGTLRSPRRNRNLSKTSRRHCLNKPRMVFLVGLSIVVLSQSCSCNAQETFRSPVIEAGKENQIDPGTTRTAADTDELASSGALEGDKTATGPNGGESASLSTRLPRQHFRLKVGPTSRASSVFKLVSIRRRAALQQQQQHAGEIKPNEGGIAADQRTKIAEGEHSIRGDQNDELNLITATNRTESKSQKTESKPLAKATTRKISSATLKKLLGQTLPKLNGTIGNSDPGAKQHQDQSAVADSSKGPSFRFVFIQRASQKVPSTNSSASPNQTSSLSTSKQSTKETTSAMASVSRQLGNSLLYSAANLMGHNFTSSGCPPTSLSSLVPSLSSLTAFVATDCGSNQSIESNTEKPNDPNKANDAKQMERNETQSNLDIRRLIGPLAATKTSIQRLATKTKPTKESRPSKIYNLPVKFIANGQPSGVVAFHSIRQQFATIKKIQQQLESGNDSSKARKKLAGGQPHLKGTNSRLIYLPLKYLSNAKPHMLSSIVTGSSKASQKRSKLVRKPGTKSAKSHEN